MSYGDYPHLWMGVWVGGWLGGWPDWWVRSCQITKNRIHFELIELFPFCVKIYDLLRLCKSDTHPLVSTISNWNFVHTPFTMYTPSPYMCPFAMHSPFNHAHPLCHTCPLCHACPPLPCMTPSHAWPPATHTPSHASPRSPPATHATPCGQTDTC